MKATALIPVVALVFLSACPKPLDNGGKDGKPDAGPQVVTCEEETDCPANQPTCQFGVCVHECQANAACDEVPGTYCSVQHICEPGCRTSSECGGGKICNLGTCEDGAGCGSKCDCAVGQVCTNGACDDPPAECNNPDDCGRSPGDVCTAYACESFEHTCIDPSPIPCDITDDCFGRLGCEGGCLCSGDHACVPDAECTIATERVDCGVGNYCANDLRCAAIPVCTNDAQCTNFGLTCDEGTGQCQRPRECTGSPECSTVPPTTFCDLRTNPGFCAVPDCHNGGVTCNAQTQTCSADGRCVVQGTGNPCTNDATCPSTQYCAAGGACADGCRNDASCTGGQACNSSHQCAGALQGLNGPCGTPEECQVGLVCYQNTCQEGCEPFTVGECDPQGEACCTLTAHACCNPLHVCSDGFGGNCISF